MTRRRGDRGVSAPTSNVTMTFACHIRAAHRGRRKVREGRRPKPPKVEEGRIPRISRLMALALHIDGLIQQGVVKDLADAARLGGVSRARLSQIMDLLSLPPDVVEDLLFLPNVAGRETVSERGLRRIVAEVDWERQRGMWQAVKGRFSPKKEQGFERRGQSPGR